MAKYPLACHGIVNIENFLYFAKDSANIELLFYPIEKVEFSVSSGITEDDYEVGIDYLIF